MTEEFAAAAAKASELLMSPVVDWARLFEPYPFFKLFKNYLQVRLGGIRLIKCAGIITGQMCSNTRKTANTNQNENVSLFCQAHAAAPCCRCLLGLDGAVLTACCELRLSDDSVCDEALLAAACGRWRSWQTQLMTSGPGVATHTPRCGCW